LKKGDQKKLKHHISYYKTDVCVDYKARDLYEQEKLASIIIKYKYLKRFEKKFKELKIITGKLIIKKIYSKDYVYDQRSRMQVILTCYALCERKNNRESEVVLALGPWLIDTSQVKPW
jgi:hypothetical protein